jgi:hypothetical protein
VFNIRYISIHIAKTTLWLLAMVYAWQPAMAQRSPADSVSYLKSYWYNGLSLVQQPLHFNADQWITAGGCLVFVGSMVALDEAINVPVKNWNSDGANRLGRTGDVAGGLPVQLGISGSALLIGELANSKPLVHFGLDNLQAQMFTGGITLAFKYLFQRARPETGAGAFAWDGPFGGGKNDAFFSGHTALAFSTANMIFLHSRKKWWVGMLSFGSAAAVGLSRMQQQKHWGSDVVMGAIMGTAISSWVYHQQEKRRAIKTRLISIP